MVAGRTKKVTDSARMSRMLGIHVIFYID